MFDMSYFSELRAKWRPLLAALIGMGSGFSLTQYITSIMAPHLISEFGWSKAEFAFVGSLSLLTIPVFPFIGRLADTIGVRRTALIGVICLPVIFVALSMMKGDIHVYMALFLAQGTICITTTSTVYSRIVVQYVRNARGLALAIVASGPALTGAIGGPLLNNFVEAHGWRAGYLALVGFTIIAGGAALLMMPPDRKAADPARATRARTIRQDIPEIIANPAFWLMLCAMLLCNVALAVSQTQLKLVMLDNGVAAAGISLMISVFAIGVLVGRFVSGVALDRFPAHLVAAIAMFLPSIGLFILGSHTAVQPVVMLAVALIGFSQGAEGDIVGYLVVTNFGVRVYSSVLGTMTAAIATTSSVGAALLALTLKTTGRYAPFLIASGISIAIGSSLFLFLGRIKKRDPGFDSEAVLKEA
jgi:predicted MFS family arabinose efflux permease